MAENLTDYLKELEAHEPPEFKPQAYYGEEEDALTFYFRPLESYGVRVNNLVTLFLSLEGNDMVGCQIKGIRCKLEKDGTFNIAIREGKINLGLFFHLLAFEFKDPVPRNRFVELGQQAKGLEVETIAV